MKQITTAKDLVDLLFLRKYSVELQNLIFKIKNLAENLQDDEVVSQCWKLDEEFAQIGKRYRNAMPKEHISGVEEEKKRRGY